MIYLECYSDKALVSAFGIPKKEINHVYSKGNICNRLAKGRNCIGLVDEDPESSQPSYFRKLHTGSRQSEIALFYDKESNNRIIALCPRLEEWILKAAKEAGVNLDKYGLPNKAIPLHEVINSRVDHFKKLVEDIKTKSQRMKTLAGFLRS